MITDRFLYFICYQNGTLALSISKKKGLHVLLLLIRPEYTKIREKDLS